MALIGCGGNIYVHIIVNQNSNSNLNEIGFPSIHNLVVNITIYFIYVNMYFKTNVFLIYSHDFRDCSNLDGEEALDEKLGYDFDECDLEDELDDLVETKQSESSFL